MRSSKILQQDNAGEKVMEFVPDKFPLEITGVVSQFRKDSESAGFMVDDAVKQSTGLHQIEKKELEEKIEARSLDKLKEIQEQSYAEGYALGQEQGKTQAYEESKAEIENRLSGLDALLSSIETLKMDLIAANESHLMKTLGQIASRLAMRELEIDKDSILSVLRRALELSQAEDNVTIRVSSQEIEHIEHLRSKVLKESDPLKRVHLEEDADVSPGGCVVQTNYGVVDATIEERLSRLWSVLNETMPQTKEEPGEPSES